MKNQINYEQFLKSKQVFDAPTGLSDVHDLNKMLFGFQRDIVGWALKRGRAAITKLSKKYSTPEYHAKAHTFYERWGVYAVVLVRFVPVLRSLLPTVAGMAEMNHKTFTLANILGAVLWGVAVTMTGYIVGDHVSNHMMFMIPAVGFLAVGVGVPVITTWWQKKQSKKSDASS
jgi:membrane protein DedA with SNARE-associated domain